MSKAAMRNRTLPGLLPLTLVMALAAVSTPARANDVIDVQMDTAKLLKMPEGTDTIVVGNPLIADVSLQRNNVMVVTGKQFGTTNMIALDKKGAIISESRVVVMSPQKDRLIVFRGPAKETYSCNPDCGAVSQIGDEDGHFKRANSQAQERIGAIRGSAQ